MQMGDVATFSVYVIGVLLLGFLARRRDVSSSEFFLAGRSMRWFGIGLSIMVTTFSSINYVAFPTEVYSHGLYVLASLPVFVLVAVPVTRIFIPFYHRMQLTSLYEYLERRFDVRVRVLAAVLFLFWRVFWMAVTLYASATILTRVTGIDMRLLLVLAGVVSTMYTAAGGMRAIIWTDIAQFFVLFGGIAVGLAAVRHDAGASFSGLLQTACAGGRLKPFLPFDPDFLLLDPRIRITLWSALIGTFTAFLTRYGADQMVVQRYFSARSLRDAQRGFWWSVLAALVSLSLLALFGLFLYVYAAAQGTQNGTSASPAQQMADLFRSLPYGLCGLISAGLLAAAMSSIDSGINACSAVYITDIHDRFPIKGRTPTAKGNPALNSTVTALLGILIIGAAFFVGRLGSLFAIANKIVHGLGSPLLAIILMGMFSRRTNATGMFWGGLLGAAWCVFVSFFVRNIALHYYATVNLLGTMALCSILSCLVDRKPAHSQLAWTWRASRGK